MQTDSVWEMMFKGYLSSYVTFVVILCICIGSNLAADVSVGVIRKKGGSASAKQGDDISNKLETGMMRTYGGYGGNGGYGRGGRHRPGYPGHGYGGPRGYPGHGYGRPRRYPGRGYGRPRGPSGPSNEHEEEDDPAEGDTD